LTGEAWKPPLDHGGVQRVIPDRRHRVAGFSSRQLAVVSVRPEAAGETDMGHTLVPLHTDLDQNDEPEVAQRGRSLDAYQAA
jgi:hypothetical protein